MNNSLVGRDRELAEMATLLAERRPSFVVVDGEPGIGKSRLLGAFAATAARHGVPCLAGRAVEFARSAPFALLLDVAASGDREPALTGQTDALRMVLSAHLPSADTAAERGVPVGVERHRVHREVRRLLDDAAGAGLLVLLDDVHWADDASVEAVDYLVRHPPVAGVVVVIACRTGRLPHPLARSLAATATPVTRLSLASLSAADVDAWLTDTPPQRRTRLHQASGGNPLYIEILARLPEDAVGGGDCIQTVAGGDCSLVVAGGDCIQAVAGGDVGTALDTLVARELAEAHPHQRLAAQAAAVAGDGCDAALVAEVSTLDEVAAQRALDGLVARDVLRAADGGLGFRHPLVRAAAYRLAGPAWRAAAHRRAAGYLQRRGASPVRCAVHLEHAAQVGDAASARLLAAAATATLATAPAIAIRWLRAALRILPADETLCPLRTELRLTLARALAMGGGLVESRAILHELVRADGAARGVAVELLAGSERMLGRLPEARAILGAELARADAHDTGTRAALLAELSAVESLDGQWIAAAAHASAALGMAGRDTRPGVTALATTLLALSEMYRCAFADGYALLDRARLLTDALSDPELCDDLGMVAALAWGEFLVDRHGDALRHLDRGLRIARRHGRDHNVPLLSAVRAVVQARLGRVADALADAEDAEEVARHVGSEELLAFVQAAKSRPLLWHTGPRAALPLVDELRHRDTFRSAWWRAIADHSLAEVFVSADEPAACRDLLAVRLPADPVGLGPTAPSAYALRSQVELDCGDRRQAVTWYERAEAVAARGAPVAQLGSVSYARAFLARDAGQYGTAREAARTAVDHFVATSLPIGEGLARMLVADIGARTGDQRAAQEELGRARELFTGCGAPWLASRVGREQRRITGHRAHQPGAGVRLSDREREVAGLVAQGLTNRQIGERLFLSPRTVETHVSRIFGKLGVTTRSALARHVAKATPL